MHKGAGQLRLPQLVFLGFIVVLAGFSRATAVAAERGAATGGQVASEPSTPPNRAAHEHIRYAIDLAERGAVYSARAELVEALSSVALTLDAQQSTTLHRAALAQGLAAIQEADDFAPQGLRADLQVNLARVVTGHRTPVLKDVDTSRLTSVDALQSYYHYASEQLTLAGRREEAASMALYGWGRLELAYPAVGAQGNSLAVPRAIALQRAALQVDAGNYLAANELAVLLARCEQWGEAKQLLLHSLSVKPTAETWYNVSLACANLGEKPEAQQAYQQYVALAGSQVSGSKLEGTGKTPAMRWVDPAVFVQQSGPDQLGSLAASPERPAATAAPAPRSAGEPASDSKNPFSHVSAWLNRKLGGENTATSESTQRK